MRAATRPPEIFASFRRMLFKPAASSGDYFSFGFSPTHPAESRIYKLHCPGVMPAAERASLGRVKA